MAYPRRKMIASALKHKSFKRLLDEHIIDCVRIAESKRKALPQPQHKTIGAWGYMRSISDNEYSGTNL